MLWSIVEHEFDELVDSKGDVWLCAVKEIHALSDDCTVEQQGGCFAFFLYWWAHCGCEAKCEAGCFHWVAIFHVEVAKDLGSILLLIDHEDSLVSPPVDLAPKEPIGVPFICDSELLFYLGSGEIRFGFGVWCKEEVVNTAGEDGESWWGPTNVDAPVWLAACKSERCVCVMKEEVSLPFCLLKAI
jgi:hypothetical protein